MENILNQAMADIATVLVNSGVVFDSWRSDAIQKILVLGFNRAFQEGRSSGLTEVLLKLEGRGIDL